MPAINEQTAGVGRIDLPPKGVEPPGIRDFLRIIDEIRRVGARGGFPSSMIGGWR